MAGWRDIADSEIDPESPVTTSLSQAWRDNPIAIAQGAAGAPRVSSDDAIDWGGSGTGASTAQDWVLGRIADAGAGAVGTYAFAYASSDAFSGDTVVTAGDLISGTHLRPSDVDGNTSGSFSGTWQCLGYAAGGAAVDTYPTLWLRVS